MNTGRQVKRVLEKFPTALVLFLISAAMTMTARADVLIATNGERFVGTVIEETTNMVIFVSGLGGRLTLVPAQIRKLERAVPDETNTVVATDAIPTNLPSLLQSTNLSWVPPAVGHDGADWVQFTSGEWLRGELKYIQDKSVDFYSDELDEQSFKLKDVRQVYTAHHMMTQFDVKTPIYGIVFLSNNVVTVQGLHPVSMPREQLTGITPGGINDRRRYWSGNASVALSLQAGNNTQATLTTSAELARRTPSTTVLLNYLGNYSQANDVKNANNNRLDLTYDIRLNENWFLRPIQFELYHDPLSNIAYRLQDGVAGGYYLFDRDDLEWTLTAGPGYQYTRFDTVNTGQSDTSATVAGIFESDFEYDFTSRLTFTQSLQCVLTKHESGQFSEHAVTTLTFKIKRHLDLNVSYIWDFLENPQTRSDGTQPQKSDQYLTVGFGVRF